MQIFVSEYVCGGAWSEACIETSLAHEGQAMLAALVEDLSQVEQSRVVTTWDARLGRCPLKHCDFDVVHHPHEERQFFMRHARDSDSTWIIAPESNDVLRQRRRLFDEVNSQFPFDATNSERHCLGASRDAIALCSDKLLLSQHLRLHGISTPETRLFVNSNAELFQPLVIKPRDGAGSQNTFLVRSSAEWSSVWDQIRSRHNASEFIQQPFVTGVALSVALLLAADGTILEIFPVAEQHLSSDGRFRYLGGRIPAGISAESTNAVQQLAERVCRTVPGLTGYVGCDIVLPDQSPGTPVLIEINPRLTSSYLGYRRLTDDNIAARLLNPSASALRWKSEAVTFTV